MGLMTLVLESFTDNHIFVSVFIDNERDNRTINAGYDITLRKSIVEVI